MAYHPSVFPAFAGSSLAVAMPAVGLYFNKLLLSERLDGTGSTSTGTQSENHSIEELVIEAASGNRSLHAYSSEINFSVGNL